jgi:hypothetical protein
MYKVTAEVTRLVTTTYELDVEAPDEIAAADIAEVTLQTFPAASIDRGTRRCRATGVAYHIPRAIEVKTVGEVKDA